MARIDFANALRGIAALVVLVSHYVVMFEQIHGEYGGFAALPAGSYPELVLWLNDLIKPIHLGAPGGRSAFLVARLFRLLPTYAVGLAISFGAWSWATSHNGIPFDRGTLAVYLSNISLFRDWIGVQQVDGVVWTLEVEAKFYLAILIFWGAVAAQRIWPALVIAALAIAVAPLHAQFPLSWNPPANFVWTVPFLAYMCIGVGFSFHYMGRLSTRGLVILAAALLAVFVGVSRYNHVSAEVPASYAFALGVFAALYAWRRNWGGGAVVSFFARISYPLYAVHAPIGYVALRYLIGSGWNAMAAFGVVTGGVTLLAWLMHVLIEGPSQDIGKRLAGFIQRAAAARISARNGAKPA